MAEIKRDPIDIADLLARVQRLEEDKAPRLVRFPFSNLISNGGFDTATGLTLGTGWSVGSGVATTAGGIAGDLDQSVRIKAHLRFRLSWTQTLSAGAITPQIIGGSVVTGSGVSASGVQVFSFFAPQSAATLRINGNTASNGTLDNLSLWEADLTDDAPWLRLPRGWTTEKYGHVYRDGTYLHPDDYTEVTVLDQTWIKPLVAPGYDTQFDIWGYQA